jgi:hypothetical protein
MVILFPLAFVSNALVPTERMPTVLRVITEPSLSPNTTVDEAGWFDPGPAHG